MSFNLAIMLLESAKATPTKPVLHFLGEPTTYAELDAASARFAGGLQAAGLVPGDVVAVQLPNVPEFLVSYFGALRAGITMLPLNPLLKAAEIRYHCSDAGAKLLIGFDMFAADGLAATGDLGIPLYLVPFPGSMDPAPEPAHRFAELLDAEPFDDLVPTSSDDIAVLLYTSGTTGKPKGAELTHFQLYMNCTVAGGLFDARADDVTLGVLPFFHVFGLSSAVNVTVRFGGTLSVVPRFEPAAVLDAMAADGVTVALGVPTMLQALMAEGAGDRDLSAFRVAVSGGASLPGEVLHQFEKTFGVTVLEGYGLSETASTATFNVSAEQRKIMSIGKPIWGVEMRVVDAEDRTLPAGEENVGELVIRGHNVMRGYHNRPEATAEAFRNGWFHTGDLGYVDDEGYYFVVDRIKDLVIRGGYNVYPREIEEVLYSYPGVAEVAVIGKPDDRLGEEVVAIVAPAPGVTLDPADVIAYAKQHLAAYKYPREVRIVDALPKGATGKILKKELRAG
jgi:long-chain acyl-CoA synthetase